MADDAPSLDALLPPAMAARAVEVGVRKAGTDAPRLFVLAVLAGAFIGLGAAFSTTVAAGAGALPYGVARLLIGGSFSLGLLLVLVGGAELFTGNNLLVMAWASGRVSVGAVLRNWTLVYAGNLVGAVGTAALVYGAGQYRMGGGAVGAAALASAAAKSGLEPVPAILLGVLCNALVCLAVWLSFSARSTTDRVLAVVPPITAFVALGFEHCVANMYVLPLGLLVRAGAPAAFWTDIGRTAADYPTLTVTAALANLAWVTAGNLVGGVGLVGAVYWFIYVRRAP